MNTAALAAEMRQASAAMDRSEIEAIARLGVPPILVDHFQLVGIARVREDRSGTLYEPDPRGRWAYITPACVQYPDTPECTRADVFPLIGNIVDLVAWDEKAPEAWRLRAGAASWLGAIPPQCCDPEPVRLWRSPLVWLRGGCTGLVPLAQERGEIYCLLASCSGGLIAEDEEHAVELRDILDHPFPAPPVYAAGREVRRAA